MEHFKLVYDFQAWERQLNQLGYKVSAIHTGFYIHNSKGTIVADIQTVDGLRGFVQGVEYANSLKDDK